MKNVAKNIAIISDYISSGGSGTFINGLINELAVKHHAKIYFFCFTDDNNSPKTFPNKNVHYILIKINNGLSIKNIPQRIIKLNLQLKKFNHINFSLIFTDLVYPTFSYKIARIFNLCLYQCPVIHHIHGSFSEEKKSQENFNKNNYFKNIKYFVIKKIEKAALTTAKIIFTNSEYSKNLTINLHGHKLPIKVNKPGIDFSFPTDIRTISKSLARKKLGLSQKQKYILFTSRIEPRKGVQDFFKNLPNNQNIIDKYHFLLCSHYITSSYLYPFLNDLDQTQLGSNVFLINSPSRKQLALFYRASDLTVMPSIDLETFGFSTLESYYYGTPVVAFNIGANPELIPNSHLVNYSSKNNWHKLYQKINYILRHPISTDYSKYNYSWENYVKNMLSFCKE